MSFETYKLSIARIFSGNKVIGAGFLVSNRHLVTCAHVVTAALGLSRNTTEKPAMEVEFDLPLLPNQILPSQRLKGRVVFWKPVNPGQIGEDIAVIEVAMGLLPNQLQAVRLMGTDEPWEHPFRIFGFPKNRDDGIWANGVLRDRQATGWVQMEGLVAQGYPIEPGFSGAPVWDEKLNAVVGMAVAAERDRQEAKAAFMIPASILGEFWNGLAYVKLEQILNPWKTKLRRELAKAYRSASPDDFNASVPETISEIIQNLDDMMPDLQDWSSSVKFVAYLVWDLESNAVSNQRNSLAQDLRKWAEQQTHLFATCLQQIHQRQVANHDCSSFLMVVVNRSRSTNQQNGDRYFVRAWFIPNGQLYQVQSGSGAISLTISETVGETEEETERHFSIEDLKLLLPQLLAESGRFQPLQNLTIELFLPAEMLNEPVDTWGIEVDDDPNCLEVPISFHYCLVMRSSDRLRPDYFSKRGGIWKEKWNNMPPHGRVAIDYLVVGDGRSPKSILAELSQATKMGIRLGKEPLQVGKNTSFAAFQSAAAPIAIWVREPNEKSATEIDCLINCCLYELPAMIKLKRQEAFCQDFDTHIGNHLVLLWDNFDRLPPGTGCNDLIMA